MNTTREPRPNELSVIQKTSSPSVTVFWLNQEQVRKNLKAGAQKLAGEHPEIEEIWLFGSLARGEAMPGSDADLLLVLTDSNHSFRERFAIYQPDFPGVGVDVFAYTRVELTQMQADNNSFVRRALAESIPLFIQKTEPILQEKA